MWWHDDLNALRKSMSLAKKKKKSENSTKLKVAEKKLFSLKTNTFVLFK